MTGARLRVAVACGVLCVGLAACTSSPDTSTPSSAPHPSAHLPTLRVHVRLVYSHPAPGLSGGETSYDGPMTFESVTAGNRAGGHEGRTGTDGWANLRVRPGTYTVGAASDPCGVHTVNVTAGGADVRLTCVAP